jgi:hypothetical protein
MKGIQLVVRFEKDNSVYVNFESSYKKKVDWDSISDEQYENMMKTAILTIEEWRQRYKFGEGVATDTSTQMSIENQEYFTKTQNGGRKRFLRTRDPLSE